MKQWFLGLSKAGKIATLSVASIFGIGTVGAVASPSSTTTSSSPQQATVKQVQKPAAPTTTTKQVIEQAAIPYETTTVNDPTLDQGTTAVGAEGINGTREVTYEVTYQGGKEISRTEVKNTITQQPITKVIKNGTKAPAPSCQNGTYINSAGNTICRPNETNTTPAEASANVAMGLIVLAKVGAAPVLTMAVSVIGCSSCS